MTILPGAFPDTISAEVKALLEEYFHLSNAASSHTEHEANEQKFAELFTKDGMYEFAEVQNVGHEAIIAFRAKLFASVPHRDHPVVKFFTFGSDDMNLMAYGRVGYKYPEGTTNMKEWAGRYKIVRLEGGALKFNYVQVILDPQDPEGFRD